MVCYVTQLTTILVAGNKNHSFIKTQRFESLSVADINIKN